MAIQRLWGIPIKSFETGGGNIKKISIPEK
jgi:hypothetical protein